MAAREIPNLKVVGSIPTWVIIRAPSLAQLAERLTVVVAVRHNRHQHVAGSIPAARILLLIVRSSFTCCGPLLREGCAPAKRRHGESNPGLPRDRRG